MPGSSRERESHCHPVDATIGKRNPPKVFGIAGNRRGSQNLPPFKLFNRLQRRSHVSLRCSNRPVTILPGLPLTCPTHHHHQPNHPNSHQKKKILILKSPCPQKPGPHVCRRSCQAHVLQHTSCTGAHGFPKRREGKKSRGGGGVGPRMDSALADQSLVPSGPAVGHGGLFRIIIVPLAFRSRFVSPIICTLRPCGATQFPLGAASCGA